MTRILWLCSSPIRSPAGDFTPADCWIPWAARLYEEYRAVERVELCVMSVGAGSRGFDCRHGGARFVHLGLPRRLAFWNYSFQGFRELCERAREFRPDLIHVHGSETFLGLVPAAIDARRRAVLSIQGLVREVAPTMLTDLGVAQVLRAERLTDLARMSGLLGQRYSMWRATAIERRVLGSIDHFLGRTRWDREKLNAIRPDARYSHVGEILRQPFLGQKWRASHCEEGAIYFSNIGGAHKGGHALLRALAILRRDRPGVRLRVSGRVNVARGYGRAFWLEAERLGLRDHVEFLGLLDESQVAAEILRSNIFVSASHMDNSPNSVAEAMALGAPVVATAVGGVPEMLEQGEAGVLVPPACPEELASALDQLLRHPERAARLSARAQTVARSRHDAAKVVAQLRDAYHLALS